MEHSRHLQQLAWPQVQQLAARPGSTVVWPWGAVEQHGPHLPLGTDGLFAERVLDAVLAALDSALPVVRLPLQSIGFSPEHRGFSGTLSLPPDQLIHQLVAVGHELAAAGFERLVLFNAHGGQIALLQTAARQLRSERPELAVLPCFLWSGPEGIASLIPEPERSGGLHAGLVETSLMLHLAPELVGSERPCDGHRGGPIPQGWSLEGEAPLAWLTQDLSTSGVIGDAGGASAALGAQLFGLLVEGWRQRLDALLRSSWPGSDPAALRRPDAC
jgi:creatinine amidohydrolase